MRLLRLAPVMLLLSYPLSAPAGPEDESDPQVLLTGGSHRTWMFAEMSTFLGQKRCQGNGEEWTFHASKALVIDQCVNGSITTIDTSWKLERRGLDVVLTIGPIGSNQYRVLFPKGDGDKKRTAQSARTMILQTPIVRTSPSKKVKELKFTLKDE